MAKGYNSRGMGGMSSKNMNMIKQAQKMQAELQKKQQELQEKEYAADAGGGAVHAVVDGGHELKSLIIQPEVVDPEDVEMLQDMVIAAVNEANRAAEEDAVNSMNQLTSGMNLPF